MLRWSISLGLLLSVSPAFADIVYVDAAKAPPRPVGAIGKVLRDSSGTITQVAIRGRVVNFAPPGTAATSFFVDFEIAKKVNNAIQFHTPPVRLNWVDIKRLVHEVDHPIDLQFLFGNLDEQLKQWKSLNDRQVGLGTKVGNVYIKHAMGLLTDAELTVQLTTIKRGPPAASWVPTRKIPASDPSLPPKRVGWMVRLIAQGPVRNPTARWQQINLEMRRDGLMFPPLVLEPATFSAASGSPVNVDISQTVRELLKAAARDGFYGNRPAMAPRGGIGVFAGVTRVTRRSVIPTFARQCLNIVRMLCGLTQYNGNTPVQRRAFALGTQARQAVIQVLNAATRGNLKGTGDAADDAELDRQIAAADPSVRAAAAARKRQLDQFAAQRDRTQLNVNPDDPGYMPVDPSLMAIAALKSIQASLHWRVPVGQDDVSTEPEDPMNDPPLKVEAGFLIKTLVELAQRPKPGDPRAGDYGRQPITTGGSAQIHRDLGVRTRLRDEIEETLCGAAGILSPDPITRQDTGKHFRPFLTPLLAKMDKGFDATFLEYCLAQSGFGSAKQLSKVIDRLFAIALANNKREMAPLPVDRLEARDRRTRAIAVLGRIAALGRPTVQTASGSRSRPPTAAEKIAADEVKNRLTELLAARDSGRANHSSERFFTAIKTMATRQSVTQNAYDRNVLQSRYAKEIVSAYSQWLRGDQARRMRELEREIEAADPDLDTERRRRLQAERDRLRKAAREFGRRFGGGSNQAGN